MILSVSFVWSVLGLQFYFDRNLRFNHLSIAQLLVDQLFEEVLELRPNLDDQIFKKKIVRLFFLNQFFQRSTRTSIFTGRFSDCGSIEFLRSQRLQLNSRTVRQSKWMWFILTTNCWLWRKINEEGKTKVVNDNTIYVLSYYLYISSSSKLIVGKIKISK